MLARAAPALPGVEGRVVGSPRTKEKHFSEVLPLMLGFYFELPALLVAG